MRLEWGNPEDRLYESGVSRGVLYPAGEPGVAWSGLTAVDHQPQGGEATPLHYDGIKYYDSKLPTEYQARIRAYGAPRKFGPCVGQREMLTGFWITRQPRTRFGLSYRTEVSEDHYKIHLVYNATATPGAKSHKSTTDRPEPSIFEWTIDAVPVPATNHKPTAHYTVDSRRTPSEVLQAIEDALYGSDLADARLLMPDELAALYSNPYLSLLDGGAPDSDDNRVVDGGTPFSVEDKSLDGGVIA